MRSVIVLALLAATAAHAKSLDDEMPAVIAAIGGEPEQVSYGQHVVPNPYAQSIALVYRDGKFWLLGPKAQVRGSFSCVDVRDVEAQLGTHWDAVQIQTVDDLIKLRLFTRGDDEGRVPKMIATLRSCVSH